MKNNYMFNNILLKDSLFIEQNLKRIVKNDVSLK